MCSAGTASDLLYAKAVQRAMDELASLTKEDLTAYYLDRRTNEILEDIITDD